MTSPRPIAYCRGPRGWHQRIESAGPKRGGGGGSCLPIVSLDRGRSVGGVEVRPLLRKRFTGYIVHVCLHVLQPFVAWYHAQLQCAERSPSISLRHKLHRMAFWSTFDA